MSADTYTLSDTSRVWVYTADRPLTASEAAHISEVLGEFTAGWAAHGKALTAIGEIRHDRFLILAVDETFHEASGCSIDASVHFIRSLGARLGIDFFDRMQVLFQNEDGSVASVRLPDLADAVHRGLLRAETLVFDPSVATIGDLKDHWRVPLDKSVYRRWI